MTIVPARNLSNADLNSLGNNVLPKVIKDNKAHSLVVPREDPDQPDSDTDRLLGRRRIPIRIC